MLSKLAGPIIVAILFFLIRFLLAPKKSFDDFFIGESGTYSLSRLQMIAWAYVIMSFQISTIVLLAIKHELVNYNLLFSNTLLWMFGLSIVSYIAVKGVSVGRIANRNTVKVKEKEWADIISGSNGLDFSKFQLLIWTVIGIVLYAVKCNMYFNELSSTVTSYEVAKYFINPTDGSQNLLPGIDSSYILLMALSHVAYLGKKVIPAFKVDEVKQNMSSEYKDHLSTVDIGIKFKENELELMKSHGQYPADKLEALQKSINVVKKKRDEHHAEMKLLEKHLS